MQNRMHGPVVHADQSEAVLAKIPAIQKTESTFAPPANRLAQKSRLTGIDFFFQRRGDLDGEIGLKVQYMGLFLGNPQGFSSQRVDRDTIPAQSLVEVQAVDGAQ